VLTQALKLVPVMLVNRISAPKVVSDHSNLRRQGVPRSEIMRLNVPVDGQLHEDAEEGGDGVGVLVKSK
jgi:hypothetical protein